MINIAERVEVHRRDIHIQSIYMQKYNAYMQMFDPHGMGK